MVSGAISSFGTELKMGTYGDAVGALTAIAEVMDISGPSMESRTEEVTPHVKDATPWAEKIATILDAGEVTFDINFVPASTAVLTTALTDQTKRSFSVEGPDSADTTWTFSGILTSFQPSAPVEGVLRASITITMTESVTI